MNTKKLLISFALLIITMTAWIFTGNVVFFILFIVLISTQKRVI
jgi:hypothetical protein